MPTRDEKLALARQLADGTLVWDMITFPPDWSADDKAETWHACLWLLETRRERERRPAQLKAMRLFRSWLTPGQRAELRRRGYVYVTGSAGGRYRIEPNWQRTSLKAERHGRREYAVAHYCLHDEEQQLPSADLALAHLLMIVTDEPGFMAAANEHECRLSLWDGAWRRRLNAAHRLRAAGVSEDRITQAIDEETRRGERLRSRGDDVRRS